MQIPNIRLATEVLGGILHLDQQVLYERLDVGARRITKASSGSSARIDPFETERLKSLHLDWITFQTESQRHYPKGRDRVARAGRRL